jgi:periplasmic protein CpxP/Spy
MNKETFYKYMMIGLLCSNLLLLYFYLRKKPPHEGPRRIIAERLHFDAAQIAQQDTIIKAHRIAIREKQAEILVLRNALYQNLIATSNETVVDSLINSIGTVQKDIEHINYHHFEDLHKICKPEQATDFNALVKDLAKLFLPPKR